MGGKLVPCGCCQRHVRTSERRCPFCSAELALSEPIEELRLLTRLDRLRMVSLGAVLSAAGIALGCREPPVAVYGAPPVPVDMPSAAPSAEPPPPASEPPLVAPAPSTSTSTSAPRPVRPAPPKTAPAPTAKTKSDPTSAPVAAYGAPPPPKLGE